MTQQPNRLDRHEALLIRLEAMGDAELVVRLTARQFTRVVWEAESEEEERNLEAKIEPGLAAAIELPL